MWLGIHKFINFIQPIRMGVARHSWACQKEFPSLNLQYIRTNVSYDGDFLLLGWYL